MRITKLYFKTNAVIKQKYKMTSRPAYYFSSSPPPSTKKIANTKFHAYAVRNEDAGEACHVMWWITSRVPSPQKIGKIGKFSPQYPTITCNSNGHTLSSVWVVVVRHLDLQTPQQSFPSSHYFNPSP